MASPKKIEISHRTIIFTIALLILLWLVYLIRDIILQFFVALLIMAILNPSVTKLSKYKIPRALSVLVVYLVLFGAVGFVFGTIIPPLAEQTTSFVNNLPRFISNLGLPSIISDQVVNQLISQIAAFPAEAARLTISVFSNIIGIVAILVFAFYLLSERQKLDEQLSYFFGERKKKEVGKLIDLLETKLGSWARGQLILMFVVGAANYVGLRLLGIPFALPLAILAGLLEIVPYIGPTLAAVPAVLIGFGISPVLGIATLSLAFLVQQLENYVLVPKIMQKATGINPVVTLLVLAVGFRLAGVVGLLISAPIYIASRLIIKEYVISK